MNHKATYLCHIDESGNIASNYNKNAKELVSGNNETEHKHQRKQRRCCSSSRTAPIQSTIMTTIGKINFVLSRNAMILVGLLFMNFWCEIMAESTSSARSSGESLLFLPLPID